MYPPPPFPLPTPTPGPCPGPAPGPVPALRPPAAGLPPPYPPRPFPLPCPPPPCPPPCPSPFLSLGGGVLTGPLSLPDPGALSFADGTTLAGLLAAASALASGSSAPYSHVLDRSNPHRVTKEQVGLGLVSNRGWDDIVSAASALADSALASARSYADTAAASARSYAESAAAAARRYADQSFVTPQALASTLAGYLDAAAVRALVGSAVAAATASAYRTMGSSDPDRLSGLALLPASDPAAPRPGDVWNVSESGYVEPGPPVPDLSESSDSDSGSDSGSPNPPAYVAAGTNVVWVQPPDAPGYWDPMAAFVEIPAELSSHPSDRTNPHRVTLTQVLEASTDPQDERATGYVGKSVLRFVSVPADSYRDIVFTDSADVYDPDSSDPADPGDPAVEPYVLASRVWTASYVGGVCYTKAETDGLLAPLAGKLEASSAAPAFSALSEYAPGALVTYGGTLYRFTAAHSGAWTGSDAEAVVLTAPDATLCPTAAGWLRMIAADGVTLVWDQETNARYPLATLAAANGAAQFADRTVQFLALDAASTSLALPVAVPGRSRDLCICVRNDSGETASIELEGLGTDYTVRVPDGEDLAEMTEFEAGARADLYITETPESSGGLPVFKIVRQDLSALAEEES